MSNKLIVVGITAGQDSITLYLKSGETQTLSNSDYRVESVMNDILPQLVKKRVASLIVEDYAIHRNFEQKTGGLVKFFQVSKKFVAGIFQSKDEPEYKEPVKAADIPSVGSTEITEVVPEDETVVAVVDNKVIPDMEKLDNQINRSSNTNTLGMENFLKRVAKIIDKRGHSVEDLLKFLDKGDLPIADDGCVVAYKILETDGNGNFVDCHTRKVKQKVGSSVFMKEDMVDKNRRNDCSNGLHIARKDYLNVIRGSVLVICKIAPEDFIAVPQYDSRKVRVSRYHIVAELNPVGRKLVLSGKPMTDDKESALLLGKIIAGDHIGVTQTVEITGSRGNGLVINDLDKPVNKPTKTSDVKPVQALYDQNPGDKNSTVKVTPQAINERVNEIKSFAYEPTKNATIKEQAQGYFGHWKRHQNDTNLAALVAFKKVKRKSWTALGLSEAQIASLPAELNTGQVSKTKMEKAPVKKSFMSKTPTGTTNEQASIMYDNWFNSPDHLKERFLNTLLDFKKSKKKSFKALGLSSGQIAEIEKALT